MRIGVILDIAFDRNGDNRKLAVQIVQADADHLIGLESQGPDINIAPVIFLV